MFNCRNDNIHPDSDVYSLKKPQKNPCWIIRSVDTGIMIVDIIDAVTGEWIGQGLPPPYFSGFSLSGPIYYSPCSSTWTSWYIDAAYWFDYMGYPTESSQWPEEEKIKEHIQSTETAVLYEIAHGGYTGFTSGCGDYTSASEIKEWITSYTKLPFAFIGSCGGMCNTGSNTLSDGFRKGSDNKTVSVGYCGMGDAHCSNCWGASLSWQKEFFQNMSVGDTVEDAYDNAMAKCPQCFKPEGHGSCMLFAGDANLTLMPVVKRVSTQVKNPLWQDQHNGTANGDDVANAIAVKSSRIFVAGKVSNKAKGEDFTVRTYNAKTGKLLWPDQSNGTANDKDQAKAIVVKGSRVFVAGEVNNKAKGEDFTVRAYNVK